MALPVLTDALDDPNAIVSIEMIAEWLAGTEILTALQRSGLASGFVVGLRVRDDPVGFLGLGSRRPTWVRPRDDVVLQMATQVADALENARLMERLEDGLEQERLVTGQLETLIGLTLIPTDSSEQAMAQLLLERVVSALAADAGLVATERSGHLEVVASLNMAERQDDTAETLSTNGPMRFRSRPRACDPNQSTELRPGRSFQYAPVTSYSAHSCATSEIAQIPFRLTNGTWRRSGGSSRSLLPTSGCMRVSPRRPNGSGTSPQNCRRYRS